MYDPRLCNCKTWRMLLTPTSGTAVQMAAVFPMPPGQSTAIFARIISGQVLPLGSLHNAALHQLPMHISV